MLNCVLYAMSLILIVLGIFFLLCMLMSGFLCDKSRKGVYSLVYYDGKNESLYDKVYTAYFQSDFFSLCDKRAVVVIGNNIPDFVKKQCQNTIAPYGKIYFMGEDEIHLLKGITDIENICSND